MLGAGPGLVYGFLESSYMLPAQVVTTATKAAAAQPGQPEACRPAAGPCETARVRPRARRC